MSAATYRVQIATDDEVTERDFGTNLRSAQAYARRETKELFGPLAYIIKTEGEQDTAQCVYSFGASHGWETQ